MMIARTDLHVKTVNGTCLQGDNSNRKTDLNLAPPHRPLAVSLEKELKVAVDVGSAEGEEVDGAVGGEEDPADLTDLENVNTSDTPEVTELVGSRLQRNVKERARTTGAL